MKLNEWKQNELNRLLMEKFSLKEKGCGTGAHNRDDKEEVVEEEEVLDELHGGCGCPDKHPGMSHDAYVIRLKESPEGGLKDDPNLQKLHKIVMAALPMTKYAACEINLEAMNNHESLSTGEWVLPMLRDEKDAKGVERYIEQHNLVICSDTGL